ncbi:hypothetical protein MKW98_023273 [Papaver atlanticum]|uniref:Uncharacterized protein n=1 Tax=Papaver atlanticum TaxID=357466 RepID=A0AAD4TCF8_9MAGN|nr:hypothetical protein MKW98_023273 [Papaver atlanticum]
MSISCRTRSKLKQRESTSLLLNLPEEVHDVIFLKLPAKSILVSRPLWYYDRGILLVDHCGEQFLLYDPTIGRVSSVPVCDITLGNNRVSYVESISSLNSGKYMEKRITNGIVKNPEPLQLR